MNLDQTMSQEPAFIPDEQRDDVFKFDKVEETPIDPQTLSDESDTTSTSSEGENDDVSSEEENRVPYSRFKSKVEELEQRDSVISDLEERLANLEASKQGPAALEDVDVPREWVELYGDSDVSKRAYAIQLQREEQLQEKAIEKALDRFKNEAKQEEYQIEENTNIIEDNLADLQSALGKKFNSSTEEAILAIVDEFSPVGSDGKYATLFPFDKAYEIYELRNAKAGIRTMRARSEVAGLTGAASNGEVDSSEGSDFKRGWDTWRTAI